MPSFLFSPGPTHIPPAITKKLAEEPAHHRSRAFSDLFRDCQYKLKQLFRTDSKVAVLTCSGSGAMEAAVLNSVKTGSEVLVAEGGKFGKRWVDICRKTGFSVHIVSTQIGLETDIDKIESALKNHPRIKAVFLTQTESSTGQLFDIESISHRIRENSDAKIIVDVFGSLGSDPFHQEAWGIDYAVCGSQKGLMCPPGLGFVSVLSDWDDENIELKSFYWDLGKYFASQAKGYTPFTPAINLIAGIDVALSLIFEDGLEQFWFEKSCIARAFREAVKTAGLKVFPSNPSSALTVFCLPDHIKDIDVILKLENDTGFRVSGGQSELSGTVIRAAHMGAISFEDIEKLIGPLFTTLDCFGYPCQVDEISQSFTSTYNRLKENEV